MDQYMGMVNLEGKFITLLIVKLVKYGNIFTLFVIPSNNLLRPCLAVAFRVAGSV